MVSDWPSTAQTVPGRRPRRPGFTLIEMLVVLAIIALLMTLAAPRYFGSLARARDVALEQNLEVVRVTIDKFHADQGRYPETLVELVEKKYLRAVPVDPVTESNATWVVVPSTGAQPKGVVDIRSGASGAAADGRSYESL